MNRDTAHYSLILVVIHWLTALLVLGAWLTAEGGHEITRNPPVLHFAFGLAVLALVLPRLILRLVGQMPEPGTRRDWLEKAARVGHASLYVLLVAIPLSGWYAASRMGVDITVLGLHLPALTASVSHDAGLVGDLHENGGDLLLILAGLHMAMALWHQFILGDGTLRRMSLR